MSTTDLKPEQKARKIIDQMLNVAGWDIVDRKHYTTLSSAVAIEEGLLKNNQEADYLLFIDGKAVGVLEAKREETNLDDKVYTQANNYTHSIPLWCSSWQTPLPIIYLSNGKKLLFKDTRNNEPPIEIKKIHTPKEIAEMLNIKGEFSGLPALKKQYGNMKLHDCQVDAVKNTEYLFRQGEKRALIVIATGAGKTYTACLQAYRLLNYTKVKRVLFLVDRNNLGKQALEEFGKFRFTETRDSFTNIFSVDRISSSVMPDSSVVICTIQRLYSMLSGDNSINDDDEESSDFEWREDDSDNEVTLPSNPKLPHDYFDLIIVDECHRSIYSSWRSVLEFFDTARIIGLTATPVPATMAFFNNNRVVNYTLEDSIAHGVNVPQRTYRIDTSVTHGGGTMHKGDSVIEIKRYNNEETIKTITEEVHYEASSVNRDIVNPQQIRTILTEFKNIIYTQLYPQRTPDYDFIPKTLIYALDEAHATRIAQIAKEVFERPDDDNTYVQKITYKSGNSNNLIKAFRTEKRFRIAVTVTLVATGTDIKPLEIVMFMRDVESSPLFIQMKGRGTRRIDDNLLRNVTPNADSKDLFYLIDAVGVTEHGFTIPGPSTGTGRAPILTLEQLLERITHGYLPDEILYDLASRLSRINRKASTEQVEEFTNLTKGVNIQDLASCIFKSIEKLPEFIDVNQPNLERKKLVSPLSTNPAARELLIIISKGSISILQPGEDEVIKSGFSTEEARKTTEDFEKYILDHKDEIEALRIIYNNDGKPIKYQLLKDLENKLQTINNAFSPTLLWNSYSIINPDGVYKFTVKDEQKALTNIIQLVRYAFHHTTELYPFSKQALQRFELWCGLKNREKTKEQHDILKKIYMYIASNGFCNIDDIYEFNNTLAAQIIRVFDGEEKANDALDSLSKFIIYDQSA